MNDNFCHLFGGAFHFEDFFKKHLINVFIPIDLIPVNGYSYEVNGQLEDLSESHRKYFMKNIYSEFYNPFDSYTLNALCKNNLLSKENIFLLKNKISKYNNAVVELNNKKTFTNKIVVDIEKNLKKHKVFKFSLSDYPLLDIRIKNICYDPYEAKNYFKLTVYNLILICPLVIEYLILQTDYFSIEDFSYELASSINLEHNFLDITFEVNEIKTRLVQANARSFIDFETNRMLSKIIELKIEIEEIEFYEPKDDYGRFEGVGIHKEYTRLLSLVKCYEDNLLDYKLMINSV